MINMVHLDSLGWGVAIWCRIHHAFSGNQIHVHYQIESIALPELSPNTLLGSGQDPSARGQSTFHPGSFSSSSPSATRALCACAAAQTSEMFASVPEVVVVFLKLATIRI